MQLSKRARCPLDARSDRASTSTGRRRTSRCEREAAERRRRRRHRPELATHSPRHSTGRGRPTRPRRAGGAREHQSVPRTGRSSASAPSAGRPSRAPACGARRGRGGASRRATCRSRLPRDPTPRDRPGSSDARQRIRFPDALGCTCPLQGGLRSCRTARLVYSLRCWRPCSCSPPAARTRSPPRPAAAVGPRRRRARSPSCSRRTP